MCPARLLTTLLAATLAACGGGGGGGGSPSQPAPPTQPQLTAAQLGVVIAQGDAVSEAIGLAYQRARGVPDANVVRVPVDTSSDVIAAADLATLKAAVDARLPAAVQATLLTWTRPSRVQGSICQMSITSALALGFDVRFCSRSNTLCGPTDASPYYDAATSRPYTDLNLRPSMMLGASTLADAQTLINRGLAADGSRVAGGAANAWLVRTNDTLRNVRWPDFQALATAGVAGVTMHYVDNGFGTSAGNVVSGQSDVMFYFTGLFTVPQIASNRYLPGAIADTLTSTAGALPDGYGQMPATDWLAAGATASYGTVEEPCNFIEKFPRASVVVKRYAAGETLIEAYWKSVQWPGEGLFVGEPLARPWGR